MASPPFLLPRNHCREYNGTVALALRRGRTTNQCPSRDSYFASKRSSLDDLSDELFVQRRTRDGAQDGLRFHAQRGPAHHQRVRPQPHLPQAPAAQDGRPGLSGHLPARALRRRRHGLHRPGAGLRGPGIWRFVHPGDRGGAFRVARHAHFPVGDRGAEDGLAAGSGLGDPHRLLRPHRAGGGQRRGGHGQPRPA